jgi:hypothetical protein
MSNVSASSSSSSSSSLTQKRTTASDIKSEMSVEELDEMMGATLENLSFIGFKPRDLRKQLEAKENLPKVVKLVTAYVQLGNKPDNALSLKRKSADKTIPILARELGTSLARLAIAYMPFLLYARIIAKAKGLLSSQFEDSGIDPVYQDVAFAGWKGAEIEPYLIDFDKAVSKTGNVEHGPHVVKKYITIAKRGFIDDEAVNKVMKDNISKREAYEWLFKQFTK